MIDTLSQKTIQAARKEHVCNYCSQKIHPGESYEKQTINYDGDIYTWKNHPQCQQLAEHFRMFDDSSDEALTGEEFREYVWEIYKSDHPDAQWNRLASIPPALAYCVELMNKQKEERRVKNG